MKEYIDHYLSLGLRPIPLAAGSKKPLIDWKPYQERSPTQEEIVQWREAGLFQNFGIICGNGLVVLDFEDEASIEFRGQLRILLNNTKIESI